MTHDHIDATIKITGIDDETLPEDADSFRSDLDELLYRRLADLGIDFDYVSVVLEDADAPDGGDGA